MNEVAGSAVQAFARAIKRQDVDALAEQMTTERRLIDALGKSPSAASTATTSRSGNALPKAPDLLLPSLFPPKRSRSTLHETVLPAQGNRAPAWLNIE
jgi:hypothetical protein